MNATLRACSTLLLLVSACSSMHGLPPGQVVGEPMHAMEIVPLATVHANPSAYFERTLLVEATAVAVCQNAGCWMQVEDGGLKAMVRWESGRLQMENLLRSLGFTDITIRFKKRTL